MNIRDEIAKLQERKRQATDMGGAEKVQRQHQRGKLAARERIDYLMDEGSFQEYGMLADRLGWRPGQQITPADAVITGFGTVNGRTTGVVAEDATVLGGSTGLGANIRKRLRMTELATQERVPLVWLFDGAGARSQDLAYKPEGLPNVDNFLAIGRLSGVAPQVGVVMGGCAGMPALEASMLEFLIMVRGTAMLAAGGPPVVLTSIGLKVSKEELGGADVHCRISGVADNPADSERDALDMVKAYLSYLPQNAWEFPPKMDTGGSIEPDTGRLLDLIPASLRKSYDMKQVIDCIVDRDSFFEIKPLFAPNMITGLARLNGETVGIIANQPCTLSGAITAKAGQKERHFIDLCTAFHIPLVFLVDVPGVMTGPESEREGALRAGLSVAYALAWSNVPKFTVVLRKAFGFGGSAMCGYGARQTLTLAWPTADFSSLPIDAAIEAAHAGELETAEDPQALLAKLKAEYELFAGAYPAAADFNVDDVIDPRETRKRLIQALSLSLNRRSQPAEPATRRGIMP